MEKFHLGIDLGGTRVKTGIVVNGRVVAKKIFPAHAANGLAANLPLLEKELRCLIEQNNFNTNNLLGIGLAFPGLVNPSSQKILSTNKKYDDAPSLDLGGWVKKIWDVPFAIDNDARMAAVGEWKYGAGRDTDNLVVMTIGTGIGSSAIIEGKLLRGKHFQAGCLGGHFSVQYNGRTCTCGNTGCVEAYGSTWSLAETISSHELFPESLLAASGKFDFATVFGAAAKKDKLAMIVQQTCMDVWSAGIVNLIHAYDPEVVVIGGGVLKSAAVILPYLQEKVKKHAWCPWGTVDIRQSTLEEDAGILGIVHSLQNSL